jgi:fimbrial chaperone protein
VATGRRFFLCGLQALLILGGGGAHAAGSTSISPVIIDVPSQGRAMVTVRNDHPREMLYQVTVMDWQVVDGADQYTVTQDFIASPPLFTLAPSTSQIVRIGFRSPVRQSLEQAYRLVLAEVPRPDSASEAAGVVDFAVQYLLPVFVAPTGRAANPVLTWSLRAEGEAMVVRADNMASRRVALNFVGLSRQTDADMAPEFSSQRGVTVLAHTWREWRFVLPASQRQGPWHLVVGLSGSGHRMIVSDADMRTFSAR